MKFRSIVLAGFLFLALPFTSSFAQVDVSVNFAPPVLPVYEQPPAPVEGYIWTPGYWAYDTDYYWVPGVWVAPPSVGLLWTPPWWGWNNGVYAFNAGYWGPTVGYYGGINYGHGYWGDGYWGGRWVGNSFSYNTAVTNVNKTVIHNTYIDKNVMNKQVNRSHTSFNGPNGVKAQPTAEQKAAAANAKKIPPTSQQLERQQAASKDPKLQAKNNNGHPNNEAIKSFNQTHNQGKGAEGVGAAGGREMLNIMPGTWPNITARAQERANLENTATRSEAKIFTATNKTSRETRHTTRWQNTVVLLTGSMP